MNKESTLNMDLVSNAKRLYQRDEEAMETLVRRCAQIHAEYISTSGDPFEFGTARPLDFGHWSTHYMEVLTDYELHLFCFKILIDHFVLLCESKIHDCFICKRSLCWNRQRILSQRNKV